jgi:hypothetical protein
MVHKTRLLIVSERQDFHAQLVNRVFDATASGKSFLLEWDKVGGQPSIAWEPAKLARLLCFEDRRVDPGDLDVIWWRRTGAAQELRPLDDEHGVLVDRCCSTAIEGLLQATFPGIWVSEPSATERAANKLVQLDAAMQVGLDVPRTCISNDPAVVRAFAEQCGNVVVKSLHPAEGVALFTRPLPAEPLPDKSVLAAPTIFQERIDGTRHLRVNCFGDRVFPFEIRSSHLDWRGKLADAEVRPAELSVEIASRLVDLQSRLGLAMSIHDLKIAQDGRVFWLEVNPQGQFLFLQGLTGVDLAAEFVSFLHSCGLTHRRGCV